MGSDCFFVIPAAGSGTRMGGDIPKIILPIGGIPVIVRTLTAIASFAQMHEGLGVHIILVSTEDLIPKLRLMCEDSFPDMDITYTLGGSSRTESVYNGIKAIAGAEDTDAVLIHDGARCLVTAADIDAVFEGLKQHAVSCSATPVKDTLKKVNLRGSDVIVESTPVREDFYAVQTPQGFRYKELVQCYEHAAANNITATDDTALAEELGIEVFLAKGSYSNIKITTPEDIAVAYEIIRSRGELEPFED